MLGIWTIWISSFWFYIYVPGYKQHESLMFPKILHVHAISSPSLLRYNWQKLHIFKMHIKHLGWYFYICKHGELITTMKLINISTTSHHYFSFSFPYAIYFLKSYYNTNVPAFKDCLVYIQYLKHRSWGDREDYGNHGNEMIMSTGHPLIMLNKNNNDIQNYILPGEQFWLWSLTDWPPTQPWPPFLWPTATT